MNEEDPTGEPTRVDRSRISEALRRLIEDHPEAFDALDPSTQARWAAQAAGQWPDTEPAEQ